MRKLKAYYLFGKTPLPDELHGEINKIIRAVCKKGSKQGALEYAFHAVVTRYNSGRLKAVSRLYDLFAKSWQDLWNRTEFLHCTNQNYLLALILVKSGHFKQVDIRRKWALIWLFSPHQYLSVKTNGRWVDVDCWGFDYSVPFGSHASGFNTSIFKSSRG